MIRTQSSIGHPQTYLPDQCADILRDNAFEAERIRALHPQQLELIHEQKWFRMFVPTLRGGLGLSLPDALKIEEGVAYADGSASWVVTLCSGAGWFAGFLDPLLLDEVLAHDKMCLAGSGASGGIAEVTDDGFRVNGRWRYATGSLHATAFTANCVIQRNGLPVLNEDGSKMVKAFLFLTDEVIVHREWNAMGMIATGSHSFEVKDVVIPARRCFTIDASGVKLADPIYRYPFLQFAETTLSINIAGMSGRFLDLCAPLFKRTAETQTLAALDEKLERAKQELHGIRLSFYETVSRSWDSVLRGEKMSQEELSALSVVSMTLANRSREIVAELYPFCGIAAADVNQEINRVWRNLHTASQHSLFSRVR